MRPKKHNNGSIMQKLKEHNDRMVREAEEKRQKAEEKKPDDDKIH